MLVTTTLWAATVPAQADSVNGGEWPLDRQHFRSDDIWAISRGSGVTVAVVDSGVSASHPDLTGQVLPGTSFLGDGADGRTDTSGDSHGTAIAGIIAGSGASGQGSGMTGLAPGAKILPVRIGIDGRIAPSLLAQGITWAVDHGAQVINVSLGSAQPDSMLRQAVAYAIRKDIVVVASAGNQGEQGNEPQYPAAFPGVVSVSGINQNGKFWAPSESGNGITIAAPASGIYSTNDQGAYVNADGTSYAAAYVSAAAALVRAHFPALSAGQVIQRLIDTTSQHHSHPDAHLGYGIVDPLSALTSAAPASADRTNPLLQTEHLGAPSSRSPWLPVVGSSAIGAVAIATGVFLLRRRRRDSSTPVPLQSTAKTARLKGKAAPGPSRRSHTKPSKRRSRS